MKTKYKRKKGPVQAKKISYDMNTITAADFTVRVDDISVLWEHWQYNKDVIRKDK